MRLLFAAATLAGVASVADGADVLWDNNVITNGVNGRAISPTAFANIRVVDDIRVGEPGWIVDAIRAFIAEEHAFRDGGTMEVYLTRMKAERTSLTTEAASPSTNERNSSYSIYTVPFEQVSGNASVAVMASPSFLKTYLTLTFMNESRRMIRKSSDSKAICSLFWNPFASPTSTQ